MRLVYKFYIRHTDELDRLFRISNNLYNQALYLFRQRLDADGVWTWYNDMDKLIKGVTNLEGECNYKLLKSQCSQQILRVLDKNMKAYCKSIKDWKKHPEKYKGMPLCSCPKHGVSAVNTGTSVTCNYIRLRGW